MGDLLLDAIGSPRHALLVATLLGIATQYLFGLLATFVVFFVLTAAERWPNLAPFALLLGALAVGGGCSLGELKRSEDQRGVQEFQRLWYGINRRQELQAMKERAGRRLAGVTE